MTWIKKIPALSVFLLFPVLLFAQPDKPYSRDATGEQRTKVYRNLVNQVILRYLSDTLSPATEENWSAALDAMMLLKYRSGWTDKKINQALPSLKTSSPELIVKFIEYLHANRFPQYSREVIMLFHSNNDPRVATACIRYLMSLVQTDKSIMDLIYMVKGRFSQYPEWQQEMMNMLTQHDENPDLAELFKPGYLEGRVVLLCLLRKSREYPGICLVRDTAGKWLRDSTGALVYIPLLGLSQTNMPGIMSNGNTPTGLFRMDGFGRSGAGFIGPSRNIQLTLPFEYKASHFFADSSLSDSAWTIDRYRSLLPPSLQNSQPLFQTYRAGKLGRSEIIIHGGTVDPAWYRQAAFYPHTPTLGCLMARENWDPATGRLIDSDMEKLCQMVEEAGGPNGYLLVVEIDNAARAVGPEDIRAAFLKAEAH